MCSEKCVQLMPCVSVHTGLEGKVYNSSTAVWDSWSVLHDDTTMIQHSTLTVQHYAAHIADNETGQLLN